MQDRGHAWVVVQFALFALLIFGPRSLPGREPLPIPPSADILAAVLFFGGMALLCWGGISLGNNLTPLPRPKDDATLVETGAFRFARHPIYGGGVIMAFAWALWVRGALTFFYAFLLLVFVDLKSRNEERWLMRKFPTYDAYRKRVRRLIPFLY